VSIVSRSSVLGTTSAKAEFVGAKTVKGPAEEITLVKPVTLTTSSRIERSSSAAAISAIFFNSVGASVTIGATGASVSTGATGASVSTGDTGASVSTGVSVFTGTSVPTGASVSTGTNPIPRRVFFASAAE